MPTITFSLKDLQNLVGKKVTIDELKDIGHFAKGELEDYDESTDEVKIEFGDTNMPYLWSVEGFARFLRGYFGIAKGIPELKLHKGTYNVMVDKSVHRIRPYISCFAAKGKKIDDYFLKQIIQLQEKFCESYGRKRQKVSIGLYSYKRLSFPIHYKAADPLSIQFVPLEFKSEMNLKEILAEHPKGKEYSWILNEFDKYPVLMDDKNEVLSFVPIINSNFTGKLEIGDDSLLFEATGTDEEAVNLAAVIFAYALSDRGFEIYDVEIRDSNKSRNSPNLEREHITIKNEQVKQLFGIEVKENEIENLLEKSQYNYANHKVEIPPYRKDILHPYDVIEDIGIMYGFDNIEDAPLQIASTGSVFRMAEFIDKVRDIFVGLGYQEVMSAILSNKETLYSKMNIDDFGTIEIDEFMSETYSVVRSWILPNLMEVLSKNKHVSYPQKIFEEGLVNTRNKEEIVEWNRVAVASSHETTNYTEMRQALDYLMKMFGLQYDIEETEHSSFIEGRVARAIVKGKKVAYLGEINPQVLSNFGIEMPVAALELNLTELFGILEK